MQEKENVMRILREAKTAIRKEDSLKLKELSNQTIHTISIGQDPDNIAVAVIIYSLSKMIERKHYKEYRGWENFFKTLVDSLDGLILASKQNDEKLFKFNLEVIWKIINKLSGRLRQYIQDVFVKAKINKASKVYAHGISREKTAKLLGITLFDMAGYIGQSGESNVPLGVTRSAVGRVKLAMELFG